ncbi:hypothetical protein DAI22_06g000066 [Oryza sativa Japonica Group]|nr:hypothetical protein DAI22_06g000066 [Oryza sativa Japonica Group]
MVRGRLRPSATSQSIRLSIGSGDSALQLAEMKIKQQK